MVHLVGRFKAVQSALAMCVTFRRLKLNTLSPLNWLFRATMLQVRGALRRSYRTLSCNSSSLSHAFHYGMMCALALWCLRTLFVRNRDAVPYFLFHLWLLWRDAACSAQTSAGPAWLPSKSKHVGPALHPYYCRHEPGLQSVTIGRLTAIHHVQGVSIPSKLYFACRTAHRPLGCVLFSIALWSRLFTFHYVPLRGVFFFFLEFPGRKHLGRTIVVSCKARSAFSEEPSPPASFDEHWSTLDQGAHASGCDCWRTTA